MRSGICQAGIFGGAAGITDVQQFLYAGQTPTRRAGAQSYLRDSSTTGDYRTPRLGRALVFNGTSERASRETPLVIDISSPFSVFMRVKFNGLSSGQRQKLFSNTYTDNDRTQLCYDNNARLAVVTFDGTVINGKGVAFSDTTSWHTLVMTSSGSTVKGYLDSVEFTGTTVSPDVPGSGAGAVLGSRNWNTNSYPFNGSMKDVRVFLSELTQEQIDLLHDERTCFDPSLPLPLAGWLCEEESGSTLYDWTGNGHHLTITGNTSVMHAADAGVKYSRANEVGYVRGKNIAHATGVWSATNTWMSEKASGDVSLEFIVKSSGNYYIIGFSDASQPSASAAYNDVDYGIQLNDPTSFKLWKSGVPTTVSANNAVGDVFRLVRSGTTYTTYINGVLVDTSLSLSASPVSAVSTATGTPPPTQIIYFSGSLADGYVGTNIVVKDTVVPRDEVSQPYGIHGNPLTYAGRVPYDATLGGLPCVKTNGTDEHISFPNHASLSGMASLTFGGWFYRASGTPTLFGKTTNTYRILGNGGVSFATTGKSWSAANFGGGPSFGAGAWIHACVTYVSGSLKIYVNGQQHGSADTSYTGNVATSSGDFYVGYFAAPSDRLDGRVFDCRVYDAELTAAQVQEWYKGTYFGTPLVALACTERSGATVYNAGSLGGTATITSPSLPTVWGTDCEHNDWLVRHGGRCRGVRFNGTNESATASGLVSAATTGLTITAWIWRSTGTGYKTICSEYGATAGSRKFRFEASDSRLQFVASDDGTAVYVALGTASSMSTESWVHVAVVFDAGAVRFYMDGTLEASTTVSASVLVASPTAVFKMGVYGTDSNEFGGSIADVRIHSSALSAADITTIYEGGHVATGHVETFPCDDSGGNKIVGDNGTELTITSSDVTQVWLPRIPGHPTNGLASDGGALTFGPGEMPADGTFANRKPADYPRLLLVEDDYAALNTAEEVGDATTDPNNAIDDGTTRHTLRTPV